MELIKEKLTTIACRAWEVLRRILLAILAGVVIGDVGILFVKGLGCANDFRSNHPQIILGLPLAGIAIVFLYQICNYRNDKGTNLVLSTLHAKTHIPFRMAPLIFISTIVTHLFGGSAGREGAALQLGGSIGERIGQLFHLDEDDKRLLVMCGMSAAFVPCMFASLVASSFATVMHVHAESFTITESVSFTATSALWIVLLGTLCAVLSIVFCKILHTTGHLLLKYLPNPYLRIVIASLGIIGLTALLQTTAYSGAGVNLIEEAFAGTAPNMAFFWKIIFTAITLGAGFKGGEIVPSFCIGATFGCLFGSIVGLSPSLCAAVAMVSVFCGVTNCPITSLLIGFELFGFDSMKFLLIGVAISYMLSGYTGLYSEQTIVYSKFKTNYINRKTN